MGNGVENFWLGKCVDANWCISSKNRRRRYLVNSASNHIADPWKCSSDHPGIPCECLNVLIGPGKCFKSWLKISNFRTNTVTKLCSYVSLLHPPYWRPNRVLGVLAVVSQCTGQWIRVIGNCGWKYTTTATYLHHLSTCRLDIIIIAHSPLLLSWAGGRVRLTSLRGVFIWSSRRNNIQFIVWYVVVGDDWNKEPVWVIVVILGDVRYNTPLMHLSALELNWVEFLVSTAHSKGGLMIWADPHP